LFSVHGIIWDKIVSVHVSRDAKIRVNTAVSTITSTAQGAMLYLAKNAAHMDTCRHSGEVKSPSKVTPQIDESAPFCNKVGEPGGCSHAELDEELKVIDCYLGVSSLAL
jgi:hypothetical protein